MTQLLRFEGISLSFGDRRILIDADLAIEYGERVCLIGRNGAGKSTTLKLITGEIQPDDGVIERLSTLRLASLPQNVGVDAPGTVREFVSLGMQDQLERIAQFERLAAVAAPSASTLRELERLEREITAGGGWAVDAQIDSIISELQLPSSAPMATLSGGWRRRVGLARALVAAPDLLLLDEPTNHLDITTIEWLESQILRFTGAVMFITHDRELVQKLATRIVDLDRGALRSWPGTYAQYLERKAAAEAEEDTRNALFDKKLAEEEAWIRQGVRARGTRNEGRVRALEAMREERAQRIKRPREARVLINESEEQSGRKVIEARNVTHGFRGRTLLNDFSLRVMRGERIGIVGNNGVGKTTLLRILLGELAPDEGSVKLGTGLDVAYFDQLRREIDESKTVLDIIGEGRDYIMVDGRRKHVIGYLTDFLFTPKQAMTRVAALSGGERNRVILAKLFTRPANLLVLDEPTNDLDVETLEALEERLQDYSGTLLIVSHDRRFLDATVTSTLVFEDDGVVRRHAGGYSDWARLGRRLAVAEELPGSTGAAATRARSPSAPAASAGAATPASAGAATPASAGAASDPSAASAPGARGGAPARGSTPRKLSYKLQRELDRLPDDIEQLEQQVADLERVVADPALYQTANREEIESSLRTLEETRARLDAAVERWGELEAQAEALRTAE